MRACMVLNFSRGGKWGHFCSNPLARYGVDRKCPLHLNLSPREEVCTLPDWVSGHTDSRARHMPLSLYLACTTLCVTQNGYRHKQVEHVVLMVKHHDPVGTQTDRTLGMVIVDTATALQAPGISTQEWFPIRKGPGMKAGNAPQGKVHVKVHFARVRTPLLYSFGHSLEQTWEQNRTLLLQNRLEGRFLRGPFF